MKRRFKWGDFGADVRRQRRELGDTLRAFAERLAIDHTTLHRAENGKPIRVPDFVFVCAFIKQNPVKYLSGPK